MNWSSSPRTVLEARCKKGENAAHPELRNATPKQSISDEFVMKIFSLHSQLFNIIFNIFTAHLWLGVLSWDQFSKVRFRRWEKAGPHDVTQRETTFRVRKGSQRKTSGGH